MVKLCIDIHGGVSIIEVSNIHFPGYKGSNFWGCMLKICCPGGDCIFREWICKRKMVSTSLKSAFSCYCPAHDMSSCTQFLNSQKAMAPRWVNVTVSFVHNNNSSSIDIAHVPTINRYCTMWHVCDVHCCRL
jgi:hypothetical protein